MLKLRQLIGFNLVLLAALAGPVLAAAEVAPGRYTMTPAENGMVRLDTQTGAVSLCTGTAGRWVCRSIADDRLALENEIDRLSNENQGLKAELSQIRNATPPPTMQKAPPAELPEMKRQPGERGAWRPSDEDVEEFMVFFEKIMNRFKQIAQSLQEDAAGEKP